jgi:hypothetical protein
MVHPVQQNSFFQAGFRWSSCSNLGAVHEPAYLLDVLSGLNVVRGRLLP